MTRDESIALLDPNLLAYLLVPSVDLASSPLSVVRANAEKAIRSAYHKPKFLPHIQLIDGYNGAPPLEIRLHRPAASVPGRAVLHVHGGGMVMGSAAAFDGRMAALATHLSAIVVSVAYRLAPETRFPGQIHDCIAAWHWMLDQSDVWGIEPSRYIISGDSAGGGLAAAACLYLRDTGVLLPAGLILVYPMLDFETGGKPEDFNDNRLGWNSANNQFGWRALLGEGRLPDGVELGYYSPAHALTFDNLPPTWIGVGTLDLFLEENLTFATNLAKAGNSVTLIAYKGAPHGFPSLNAPISAQFYKDYHAAFRSFVP